MLSLLPNFIFLSSLALPLLAQVPDRFASENPESEKITLSQIVEDEPGNGTVVRKRSISSPAYTLYSAALPIPPIAQVKQ